MMRRHADRLARLNRRKSFRVQSIKSEAIRALIILAILQLAHAIPANINDRLQQQHQQQDAKSGLQTTTTDSTYNQDQIQQTTTTTVASSITPESTSTQDTTTSAMQEQQQQQQATLTKSGCKASLCSRDQFTSILQRISAQDVKIVARIRELDSLDPKFGIHDQLPLTNATIELVCLREIMDLIKELASNELELKEIMDLANDVDLAQFSHKPKPLSSKKTSTTPASTTSSNQNPFSNSRRLLNHDTRVSSRIPFASSTTTGKSCKHELGKQDELSRLQDQVSSGNIVAPQPSSVQTILVDTPVLDKNRATSKAVANIDHWIQSLERFVATNEWNSLRKVLKGIQSIMETFSVNNQAGLSGNNKLTIASNNKNSSKMQMSEVLQLAGIEDTIDRMKKELPDQLQALTNSLNYLFPWHIWPWNNVDLYSTIDSFLNHAIFALSNTSLGPNRRINQVGEMVEVLIRSLKLDSFPKKCNDWSSVICDRAAYEKWLSESEEPSKRILGSFANQSLPNVVQELSCIVFSSLSVQKFALNATTTPVSIASTTKQLIDQNSSFSDEWSRSSSTGGYWSTHHQTLTPIQSSQLQQHQQINQHLQSGSTVNNKQATQNSQVNHLHHGAHSDVIGSYLAWDVQVLKALKAYKLSRAALTDQQWLGLYKLTKDIWSQQKISDRVIMGCRIVQLLSSCRMPREVLESALWKDIYKYKNALNQLIDIIIEELNRSSETGMFTIDQLALGSKHLHEILVDFLRLLPKLLESLTQTFVDDLPELVNRFFHDRHTFFRVPCKGNSFADIIPNLNRYRGDIVQLERLICQQFDVKPNITMMKINNFTNEFLAMAFNFTSFNQALGLPELVSNFDVQSGGHALINHSNLSSSSSSSTPSELSLPDGPKVFLSGSNNRNITSILDEMGANQRLAQIVAILQSSALDPPEVQAELPELDWVEAGTSVAMLYESLQKLLSHEGDFIVFPEVSNFQGDIKQGVDKSDLIFRTFSKRDPLRLAAYSLDTTMPIALRTFKSTGSFNSECITSIRDLIGEDNEGKATRQYQCLISSLNYASWALNQLMKMFNDMFTNILQLSSPDNSYTNNQSSSTTQTTTINGNHKSVESPGLNRTSNVNKSCVFLDGSINYLFMNTPQLMDLILEASMTVSIFSDQSHTLESLICKPNNYQFDSIFAINPQNSELKSRVRSKLCKAIAKESLGECRQSLKFEEWIHVMADLNRTWFESSPISLEPSFRGVTFQAHRFLQLFGQFKPQSFSDGIFGRLFGTSTKPSFVPEVLNRVTQLMQSYYDRKFELALQILTPIIADNLPTISSVNATSTNSSESHLEQINKSNNNLDPSIRQLLISSTLSTQAITNYLINKENNTTTTLQQSKFDSQVAKVLDWSDNNSLIVSEVLLRTLAYNSTRFESLFKLDDRDQTNFSETKDLANQAWLVKLCNNPIDTFLNMSKQLSYDMIDDKETIVANHTQVMSSGKDLLCNSEWLSLQSEIRTSEKQVLCFSRRQLSRIVLSNWGHLLDLLANEAKPLKYTPAFFRMKFWQSFQEKLGQVSPNQNEPSNLLWLWRGIERLIIAADNGSLRTVSMLARVLEQLNCGLDAIKGGLTWDNLVNIYQDKQDVLAAHSTFSNLLELVNIAQRTFTDQDKFQLILEKFIKPKGGFKAFCEIRDRNQLETLFSIKPQTSKGNNNGDDGSEDADSPLESLQELICDTNLESMIQNMNPISACYQQQQQSTSKNLAGGDQQVSSVESSLHNTNVPSNYELANGIDRLFKLTSLAILDAKLAATTSPKSFPLEKLQQQIRSGDTNNIFNELVMGPGKINISLTIVRLFQTLDSINPNQFAWRAMFKSLHEISELITYSLRAIDKRFSNQRDLIGIRSKIVAAQRAIKQIDTLIRQTTITPTFAELQQMISKLTKIIKQEQQLDTSPDNPIKSSSSSTLPEQKPAAATTTTTNKISNGIFDYRSYNQHISYKTFKQLRYIRSMLDYFTSVPDAQKSLCSNASISRITERIQKPSRLDLIGYKLDTTDKLYALLCHYHPNQWLRVLNIIISPDTNSIPKKINLITRHLAIFTRNYNRTEDKIKNFIHNKQLRNIESSANVTISYLMSNFGSHSRLFNYQQISNFSIHSIPNLLDSMDSYVCPARQTTSSTLATSTASPKANTGNHQSKSSVKWIVDHNKIELEVMVCQMPQWNFTQVYTYLGEKFDLQKLISLMALDEYDDDVDGNEPNSTTTTTTNTTTTITTTTSHNDHRFTSVAGNNEQQQVQTTLSITTRTKQQRPCVSIFGIASRWMRIMQSLSSELSSKKTRERVRKCLSNQRKGQSAYSVSLRYVKMVNNLLSSVESLVQGQYWSLVKDTWNSLSYYLLHETPSYLPKQLY